MKKAGKHDYSGCYEGLRNTKTFSVGIFEWIPTKTFTGLKKSAVKFRIRGRQEDAKLVRIRAMFWCHEMDRGRFPKGKSETVRNQREF